MIKTIKNKIRAYLLRSLVHTVEIDDILVMGTHNNIALNGRILTEEEISRLKTEVNFFAGSMLFELMVKNRTYLAQEQLIVRGKSYAPALRASILMSQSDRNLIKSLSEILLDNKNK